MLAPDGNAAALNELTPSLQRLQQRDINLIHGTTPMGYGWLLSHQETSFSESKYNGDLGRRCLLRLFERTSISFSLVSVSCTTELASDGPSPGSVDVHNSD
ncbi:hypothetical protein K435DRAFT_874081 [Dendrothele bispora CBS 962.96]|uniref:Uncharacterized protein n=1 Tax=Dendrothele bispora (strain CBS 962.96) TaxID=1314807 RepID=A0A4S8KXI9_DENBC|nr:hypothetical protein K435DRAFT_874081 [Dendrothele bispora CBS 962.96]